jgi:cytochrome-b5 reductase
MEAFPQGTLSMQSFTIHSITPISADSKLFIFSLPSPSHFVGLRPGQHAAIRAFITHPRYPAGKDIKRKYTPTSKIDAQGLFEFPVKIYRPVGDFLGGLMTTYLDSLAPGTSLNFIGPIGKYVYQDNGKVLCKKERTEKTFKKFAFIAGGSGITPCFQYIQYICDRNENIELSLIYANRTENDIWLRKELEEYQREGKLRLFYTVNEATEGWRFGVGFVTADMIRSHLPPPAEDTCVFFCGPKPMNGMLRELLPSLGYTSFIKF